MNKIQEISRHSRVFTLGVGSALNKHLMNRMSRVGLGCCENFDTTAKSKWEGKVQRQINRAFQPALGGIEVEWKQYGVSLDTSSGVHITLTNWLSSSRENIKFNLHVFRMEVLHLSLLSGRPYSWDRFSTGTDWSCMVSRHNVDKLS